MKIGILRECSLQFCVIGGVGNFFQSEARQMVVGKLAVEQGEASIFKARDKIG